MLRVERGALVDRGVVAGEVPGHPGVEGRPHGVEVLLVEVAELGRPVPKGARFTTP